MEITRLDTGQQTSTAKDAALNDQTLETAQIAHSVHKSFLLANWRQVLIYLAYCLACLSLTRLSNLDLNNALSAAALFISPYKLI